MALRVQPRTEPKIAKDLTEEFTTAFGGLLPAADPAHAIYVHSPLHAKVPMPYEFKCHALRRDWMVHLRFGTVKYAASATKKMDP